MKGDLGPYMNDDGDIWVPRTIPYLKAREVAGEAIQTYGYRLHYVGKGDALLFGFTRDCRCLDGCEAEPLCEKVPVWHFEEVET